MFVYQTRLFNITIFNFGKVDLDLPVYQNAGEIADVPFEIMHSKSEPYHYTHESQENDIEDTVNIVPCRPRSDHLEQIVVYEAETGEKE